MATILPINLIDGVTQEQIAALSQSVDFPETPDIINVLLFGIAFTVTTLGKIGIVLSVSSTHQLIGLLITIFSITYLVVLWSMIRGN